ncbi:MAG: inosine/xanthosine triphosphatase [Crenarchaeota archaeon]|nr:inosine/xanthosine triphosphatase [Thermoproteota archaeon]
MIRVAVGSRNPSKIEGVKRAYETFGIEVEIIPVDAESKVSRQPRSLDETVRGALNRAFSARDKVDADEYVGVESGLMYIPYVDRIVDVTVAVICDRQLRITVGLSPAFEVPPDFVRRLYGEDIELEDIVVEITGIENIGEKGGFISFLTNGKYERSELVRQAVLMALTPRICPIKRMYRME